MTVGAHLSQRLARAGDEAVRDAPPSLLLRGGATVLGGGYPSVGDAGGEHAAPVRVGPLGGTERTGRVAGGSSSRARVVMVISPPGGAGRRCREMRRGRLRRDGSSR